MKSFLFRALILPLGLFCAGFVPAAPVITVFNNRVAFETAIGPGRITDDFSGAPPILSVTTVSGAVSAGKWRDIAGLTNPSTVWQIPFGTAGWGGTCHADAPS